MENNSSKFRDFLLSGTGKATMIALFYVIIFGLLALSPATNSPVIGLIISVICAYFGWQALDKIQPDIFLIMPLIGWIIYVVVKAVLSFLIGIFVAPLQIAKKITNSIQSSI